MSKIDRKKVTANISFALALFCLVSTASATDRVVVVPLGGAVGDATASDVLAGKTFTSKTAGKGFPGTLEIRDGSRIYTNSIGMKFSKIPAGSFVMGTPDGTGDTSHPPVNISEPARGSAEKQHTVSLTQSFYMETTEVTQGQWEAIMGANSNPSSFTTCGTDCPVEQVSWNDVQLFVESLNVAEGRTQCTEIPNSCYSLPTESQWEYAVRAGTVTAYYNGNITDPLGVDHNLELIGWYNQNSAGRIHKVAQKEPNNWGLYDMSGNVSEWCSDWYGEYPDGPVTDPTGEDSSSSLKVLRGGNYSDYSEDTRSGYRYRRSPASGSRYVGFRLVLLGDI